MRSVRSDAQGLAGLNEQTLGEALRVCEEVASRDRSNLYLVSRYLLDRRRYDAFIAMYAVMRVIDDFVDSIADVETLTNARREAHLRELSRWRERIRAAHAGTPQGGPLDVALCSALSAFPIPLVVWSDFLDAMAYDLGHVRFVTPESFLRYAEGAAAAPTTIFVFLLTADASGDEQPSVEGASPRYEVRDLGDGFDVAACGRDLGIFAYIAHILRDVSADLRLGRRGRIYIPESDLALSGLSEADFRAIVSAASDDPRWSRLAGLQIRRARRFERSGVEMAGRRMPAMKPDCRFILSLIVRLYQDLLGRIEADPHAVLKGRALQSESHLAGLIAAAAQDSGFAPPAL